MCMHLCLVHAVYVVNLVTLISALLGGGSGLTAKEHHGPDEDSEENDDENTADSRDLDYVFVQILRAHACM